MVSNQIMMMTRRKLVESDVDTEEAPVGEDVWHWPDTAGSGSPSPDSVHRSSISFKAKEPTLSSSVVVGRAMRTDDRLVPTTLRTGLGGLVDDKLAPQRGAMVERRRNRRVGREQPHCRSFLAFWKGHVGRTTNWRSTWSYGERWSSRRK